MTRARKRQGRKRRTWSLGTLSENGIWLRGAFYVIVGGLSFLLNDATFRAQVAPLVLTLLGATNAGLIALRAYLDLSPARGQGAMTEAPEDPENSAQTDAELGIGKGDSQP